MEKSTPEGQEERLLEAAQGQAEGEEGQCNSSDFVPFVLPPSPSSNQRFLLLFCSLSTAQKIY